MFAVQLVFLPAKALQGRERVICLFLIIQHTWRSPRVNSAIASAQEEFILLLLQKIEFIINDLFYWCESRDAFG
jgi:hypothetical protein